MPKNFVALSQFIRLKKNQVIRNIQLSRTGYASAQSSQTALSIQRQVTYLDAYKGLNRSIEQAKMLLSDSRVDYLLDKVVAKDTMRGADALCFDFHPLDARIEYLQLNCHSLAEFYQEVVALNYANCTTQAMCLCHLLEEAGLESKLFGITSYHDVVIVLGLDKRSVVISDPWADCQFDVQLEHQVASLNELLHPEDHYKIVAVLADYFPFAQHCLEEYRKVTSTDEELHDALLCAFPIHDPNQHLRKVAKSRDYQTRNDSEMKQTEVFFEHSQQEATTKQKPELCVIL
ncbi:hypothetical protein L3V82_01575 [Thiotrichales bacterium 19S3-7]|nr:hypothetical protein [Thiotrichales bacterium 19S3-7]MCF6800853.1 hypothetical protein [Thiotrichales bacterium 19S3-11]